MSHAVSLAQDGLFGKACNVLVSQGIAPNCDETWNLLVSKHPKNDSPSVPVLPQSDVSLPTSLTLSWAKSIITVNMLCKHKVLCVAGKRS